LSLEDAPSEQLAEALFTKVNSLRTDYHGLITEAADNSSTLRLPAPVVIGFWKIWNSALSRVCRVFDFQAN